MGDLRVCRICLNMDVEMQDLMSFPLVTFFASMMIDSKPLYTNLPPYACYQCAALVKKFHLFREKCLRSQVLLCGMIDDSGKLTPTLIKTIVKTNLLAISNVSQISIEQDTTDCLDIDQPVFVTEVKKEYHENDDLDIPDHCSQYDGSSDDESKKSEKLQDMEKVEIQVKMDEELDGSELPETIVDVPKLPVRKTRLGPSKKEGRSKRVTTKTKKRMKEPVASEDNTDMDDITVVTLSLEEQIEEMNKRKQSSNYLNCPYQCHLCFKGFNNTHAWKHHLTKHSPTAGDIECTICKYRFKTKRNLQRHALNHGKKFVCKLCPYNSSNITTVKQHQGSHKGVTYKCKYCDEVFTVRTTYVSHMRIKHPSENICGYCGYSFYSKRGLVVHKNMVHKDCEIKPEESTEDGPYCAECDVKFVSSVAYKRHMVMSVKHTQTTDSMEHPKRQPLHYRLKGTRTKWPAQCEHCPEEIANARAYWKHFRLMHPNENYPVQKKCVCDICGKRFTIHSGDNPYKCEVCGVAFSKSCTRTLHVRTVHTKEPAPPRRRRHKENK
ncbi:unnamed protein product [Spodoptera exigua]|nr:unnamed protein product [Spodoptera exigua]